MAEIPNRLQVGQNFEESKPMINDAFNALDGENRTKVIKNGTTPTLLFGFQKGGFGVNDYGLKIAKAGVDVTTATADQLAFSSAFNTLKIVETGIITAIRDPATTTRTGTYTYADLGYTPMVIGAIDGGAGLPLMDINTTSGLTDQIIQLTHNAFTRTLTLKIMAPNYAGNPIRSFGSGALVRYYLLRDTAN